MTLEERATGAERTASPRRAGGPRRRRRRKVARPTLAVMLWGHSATAEPSPRGRARLAGVALQQLVPLVLYLALAAAMTYPLLRDFDGALVGNNFDAWQNLWNFWWTRLALERGQNPFQTPLLYAPDGAPLYLHTLNLFNGLLSLPFQYAGNLIAAYNAVVLASFVLSAYFAYLLVAYVSGSRRAGFVGGIVYGFSAYQLDHLSYGQTNLLASEWLPAYCLCLLRATDTTGRRRTLYVVAAACALFLLMLCDWQYVIFAILFTFLWVFAVLIGRRDARVAPVAGAIGVLWALLALPILIPTFNTLQSGITAYVTESYLVEHSADLLSLIVPGSRQRWWQALTERVVDLGAVSAYARGEYLGFVPLGLAVVGVLAGWRRARFWLVTALVGVVLALGPVLQIAGQRQFGAAGQVVPLPYRLLQGLPGLAIARVPTRYTLLAALALAVLTGLGLAAVGRRVGPRLGVAGRLLLAGLLSVLLLGEQVVVPYPSVAVQEPAFARYLAAQPGPGTVLVLPFSFEDPYALYWQTIHGRPMIAGYLSRPVVDPLLTLPPFRALVNQRTARDIVAPDPPALSRQVLAFADVRWVVVDLAHAQREREPLASFLADEVEATPIYDDSQFAIYRPLSPAAPAASSLAVRIGPGWYEPEPLAGSPDQMRWLERSGTVYAWNLGAVSVLATIRFDAWSFDRARTLEVRVDGRSAGTWTLSERRTIALPVTLGPGRHEIVVRAVEPPIRPIDVGLGRDPRPLAVGVARVSIER